MCGLCGVLSLRGDLHNPAKIKPMCDVIAHRGPDDAGYAFFSVQPGNPVESHWLELTDNDFKNQNIHLPPIESDHARREIANENWQLVMT